MADVPPGVKGMNDILAPEVSKWQFLEQQARDVLEAFAFHELRTPVLEYTPLFVRSVGEVTDVVEKQMYTFDDRDGRSVSLRPEGTASAVRAYVEAAQWNKEPLTRWYYIGPMFRHERAQRGRLRQFYQVGAEVFGSGEPSMDAEMIAMIVEMLVRFGLDGGAIEVNVNSLGEPEEREAYRNKLVGYFSQHRDKLDDDSRRRLETNPLRILDSKNPDVIAVAAGAPKLIDELNEGSRARFARVRALLDALGVKYQIDPGLVRGLDYYTGTIFELKTKAGELGAQNTVAGGGRYDRLVSSLGGPNTPAIGFALGIERALLAIPDQRRELRARAGRLLRADGRGGAGLRAADRPAPARQGHPHRDRAPAGQGRQDDGTGQQAARARRGHHRQQRDRFRQADGEGSRDQHAVAGRGRGPRNVDPTAAGLAAPARSAGVRLLLRQVTSCPARTRRAAHGRPARRTSPRSRRRS